MGKHKCSTTMNSQLICDFWFIGSMVVLVASSLRQLDQIREQIPHSHRGAQRITFFGTDSPGWLGKKMTAKGHSGVKEEFRKRTSISGFAKQLGNIRICCN